ncbi:SurA N-terminal domain-containing protein [Carboxylicivirga sp. N1Y90]|uniref:peptidylprolyl isomerase n=1 Tax=Carboxylicivirga fragile TaxID=3417571 RepID=UPI003D327374|nr:SurA N-terminal domain-containing protein [Marinilabiliaceae bacterium N1Y90]
MATLEKIRNRAGIVIFVIGLGLVAFLLGDFLNSGGSMFRSQNMVIGEIDGTSVSYPEYQQYLTELEDYYKLNSRSSALDENTSQQLREQAWNQMVQDVIMNDKYDELGVQVTADELLELATGKNVHPQIRQMFTNPQTGQFDKAQVVNFLQQKKADPQAEFYWLFLEKQIKKERLFTKYRELIKKGMYVTNAQAKSEAEAKQVKVDFDFVVKRYATVADSAITISDSEIKDYYKKNIDNYKQEAIRDIEYVSFVVEPSEDDKKMAQEKIDRALVDFSKPEIDAVQFVKLNSEADHIDRNLKIEQIASNLQGFIATAEVNEVYGPYFENDTYKLTRLVEINQIPDSAKARHILVKDPALADSLYNLVKSGADFAAIARTNSQDPGSAVNGGDLGWFKEGAMVGPFNDACFEGKKGDIVKVETQFGTHIINIQDKGRPVTKYKLATLEQKLSYSTRTNQDVYAKAAKFAALNGTIEKFNASVKEENLIKRYGRSLKKNDRSVGNLEHSRELIRWAFKADVNDMSEIYEFGDEYVIAYLTGAKEEGSQSINVVRASIERELRNEKKAEMIIAEIKGKNQSDMTALASSLESEVQSATGIDFGAFQVPGAGVEPALVAAATATAMGEVSAPVAGNNGVYVVKVNNVEQVETSEETEKAQLKQNVTFKIDYQATEAIKKQATIVDDRSKFF